MRGRCVGRTFEQNQVLPKMDGIVFQNFTVTRTKLVFTFTAVVHFSHSYVGVHDLIH